MHRLVQAFPRCVEAKQGGKLELFDREVSTVALARIARAAQQDVACEEW
jgi:hypothetical protein